jgi:serine/threonine protein kinase
MNEAEALITQIHELTGWIIQPNHFRVHTDTTQWMDIVKGHVIRVGGKDYAVRGNMNEPRFGIDEQPKYWVFSAIDLETGKEKIIKTVFNEEFTVHIGIFKIRCYRSQEKESKVLDLVTGDTRFMQGITCYDEKGNNVRIMDYIRGQKFFHYIPNIKKSHKQFFDEDLKGILWKLLDSIEAIKYLHEHKLFHGDIRNDHIIIDADTGRYRWIDFDLNQDVTDFDLWSIGNVLSYTVGKGICTFDAAIKNPDLPESLKKNLCAEDGSAFYEYRIMNLKKLFPYIPEKLNDILLNFTIKPPHFYKNIDEFIDEYVEMLEREFPH